MKKTMRLDKLLAAAGYGSRKEIKALVKEGVVAVNGLPVKDSSRHVNREEDIVAVNGNVVSFREFIYLMLNKPAGCISATTDNKDKTVLDLVPEVYLHYELFPVGRLDKDTEGLLLLTNDGKLAHELLAPKKHVPKTYFVRVDQRVGDQHLEQLAEGVTLDDGYQTKPAKARLLAAGPPGEVDLTIVEGKFHQVKRMFKALDMNVIYLQRTAMGGVKLDPSLRLGEIRELTPEEMAKLKKKP
jgi:16S rRNA pseudouridine516 synthase